MPEETTDVAVETETVNDGKVSMDRSDSETDMDSSTEKTETQDTSGKDAKTASEDVSSDEGQEDKELEEALKKEGAPIPYERFKQWNEKSKTLKSELATLKAEQGEVAELLNDPNVFKAVLQAKGITDPQILAQKMKEAGFETGIEPTEKKVLFKKLSEGLDLTKQDDWFEMMERMVKHYGKEVLSPIERKLNEKEVQAYIESQETEAKKLSKDTYGLEYGVAGKDESNPNTAVGKMWKYLEKHPEDAGLGHTKILRLALADEGVKLGEEKGKKKELDRQKSLKSSAMEDDAQVGKDEVPSADWSVSKLMAYRRKYGK